MIEAGAAAAATLDEGARQAAHIAGAPSKRLPENSLSKCIDIAPRWKDKLPDRLLTAAQPNQVWTGADWLYLAVIPDPSTRESDAWPMEFPGDRIFAQHEQKSAA